MTLSNLSKLRLKIQEKKINFLILPNSDEFFLEYLPNCEKRIEFLTGFNGSNALLIVGEGGSSFFTDSRYIIQANKQLDLKEFEIFNMAEMSIFSWIEKNIKKNHKLAIFSKLFSLNFIKNLQKLSKKQDFQLVFLENEFIDDLWKKRPNHSNSKIFHHKIEFSGVESKKKIQDLTKNLDSKALFLTNSESICWLLNIRAGDVEYSPLLACYAVLYKNNEIDLFIDKKRLKNGVFPGLRVNFIEKEQDFDKKPSKKPLKQPKINIIHPKNFEKRLKNIENSVQIDPNQTNYWLFNLLKSHKLKIKNRENPILIKKAVKNRVEIKNMIKAHEIDGLAVTKFLFWLEKNSEKSLKKEKIIDELICEQKILNLRKKSQDFHYPSFRSISGFAENGAIIHYSSNKKTNKKFIKNSLYLLDSGGQYNQGTTDITRTISIGQPTKEMKHNFTLVLKGHIALAQAKFSEKKTGDKLDYLARQFLLQENKNYGHGTGHGVGAFLSVHEGPVSISPRSTKSSFKAGMILSNEPGFYQENNYGIRIENLVLVVKNKDKLEFKTLTLAPIDINLIESEILSKNEKNWLKNYHKKILKTYKNNLSSQELSWLKKICEFYNKL